jgi:hypothetical protein
MVIVARCEQANEVPGAVYNQREEPEDIPTEHAHVERLRIGHGRILPVESHFPPAGFSEAHLGVHEDSLGDPAQTAEPLFCFDRGEPQSRERGSIEDRAVSTAVHEGF